MPDITGKPTRSDWRLHARWVISQAVAEGLSQGLDAKALLKLIDSRYPFGSREMHPYAMWLKERRLAIETIPALSGVGPQRPPACKFCLDAGCIVCKP